MDEKTADHFIWFYESLEAELIKLLYYIAPYDKLPKLEDPPSGSSNWDVWSPHFGRIIVDACGIIDSLVTHLIPDKEKKKLGQIINESKKLLCKVSEELKWVDQKVIVFLSPPTYLSPFSSQKWREDYWWQANNNLKHNRIANLKCGTLKWVLYALAGSLLAIVTMPRSNQCKKSGRELEQLGTAMLRRGWLNLESMNEEKASEKVDVARKVKNIKEHLGEGKCIDRMVETSLFAVSLGQKFPGDVPDFDPSPFGGSIKLTARLLGSKNLK